MLACKGRFAFHEDYCVDLARCTSLKFSQTHTIFMVFQFSACIGNHSCQHFWQPWTDQKQACSLIKRRKGWFASDQMMIQVEQDYRDQLHGLTGNNKSQIDALSQLADDHKYAAKIIVRLIEEGVRQVHVIWFVVLQWWSWNVTRAVCFECLGNILKGLQVVAMRSGKRVCLIMPWQVKPASKLLYIYVMDSILKNVREPYVSLFAQNLPEVRFVVFM